MVCSTWMLMIPVFHQNWWLRHEPDTCTVTWKEVKEGEEAQRYRIYSGTKCSTVDRYFQWMWTVLLNVITKSKTRLSCQFLWKTPRTDIERVKCYSVLRAVNLQSIPWDTYWHRVSLVQLVEVAAAQEVVTEECQLSCWFSSLAYLLHCQYLWLFGFPSSFPDWLVSLVVLALAQGHLLRTLLLDTEAIMHVSFHFRVISHNSAVRTYN
jgi:hypothetical protein